MAGLNHSQQQILRRLKVRGPQSVKILARQLDITTMGIRQHLAELEQQGFISSSRQTRQTRGRPVHLWRLTDLGHEQFDDGHERLSLELLDALQSRLGATAMDQVLEQHHTVMHKRYQAALAGCGEDLLARVQGLARLRSEEGFMAEIRLLPDGWLLIENHCPIAAAARHCQQFCGAELDLFRSLLGDAAHVERVDHLLTGSRRCAYRISPR